MRRGAGLGLSVMRRRQPSPNTGSAAIAARRWTGPGLHEAAAPGAYQTRPQPARVPGALPGEMKQVTVLFCDIVGSTPLTERLGAEAMRDLVHAFLAPALPRWIAMEAPRRNLPATVSWRCSAPR